MVVALRQLYAARTLWLLPVAVVDQGVCHRLAETLLVFRGAMLVAWTKRETGGRFLILEEGLGDHLALQVQTIKRSVRKPQHQQTRLVGATALAVMWAGGLLQTCSVAMAS